MGDKVREKQNQAAKKRKEAPSTPTASPAKKKQKKDSDAPTPVETTPKKSPKAPEASPKKSPKTPTRKQNLKGGTVAEILTLGKGEVIKGMDTGVEGMLLNEKRKLTIPAPQAYGSQRMGDIPSNSALEFEVTLLRLK